MSAAYFMPSIGNWELSAAAQHAISTYFDRLDEKAILDFLGFYKRSSSQSMAMPSAEVGREILKTAATSSDPLVPHKAALELIKLCMVSCEFIVQLSGAFIREHQEELAQIFGIGFYEVALAIDERHEVRELLKTLPSISTLTLEERQAIGGKLLNELAIPAKLSLGLD